MRGGIYVQYSQLFRAQWQELEVMQRAVRTAVRASLSTSRLSLCLRCYHQSHSLTDLVSIQNGTFYHSHPAASTSQTSNPPYFAGLTFNIEADVGPRSDIISSAPFARAHWAVIGSHDTATFLDVLRGNLFCDPPSARAFPFLASDAIGRKDARLRISQRAIQYVGFNAKNNALGAGAGGVRGAYLSARYESHREETDWTVLQYLKGDMALNLDSKLAGALSDDDPLLLKTIRDLRLEKLINMPVSNLSNGQTRRARIAKSLLSRPELLLLDEPFMGLDPPTLTTLSPLLKDLAFRASPLLVLALRPQDPIPDWITHLVVLGAKRNVMLMDEKEQTLFKLRRFSTLYKESKTKGGRSTIEPGLKEWVTRMVQMYGEPPDKVGDSLNARGVHEYDVHEKVQADRDAFLRGSFVHAKALSGMQQQHWEAANKQSPSERSDHDWWSLIASLPDQFSAANLHKRTVTSSASSKGTEPDLVSTKRGPPSSSNSPTSSQALPTSLPLIELDSVVLRYGTKTILGHPPAQPGFDVPGLNLTVYQGSRLALLGPNGSGKTTLLSLLTSDHPQSYSLPIRFFGRDRLPSPGKPGLSLWEIQSRIGHSSPEVHAFFPKRFTVRRTLESAWAETFGSRPEIGAESGERIDRVLGWWQDELRQDSGIFAKQGDGKNDLSWADNTANHTFGLLPFSSQRLLLLLRAIIKIPDIVILDEAFSGLSAEVRDKAMCFLEYGEGKILEDGRMIENLAWKEGMLNGLTDRQALVIVSHLREEIPACVNEWIRLPSEEEATEMSKPILMGKVEGEGIRGAKEWNRVWGL